MYIGQLRLLQFRSEISVQISTRRNTHLVRNYYIHPSLSAWIANNA